MTSISETPLTSEPATTWKMTDLVKEMAWGRVSKVTLASLLSIHLQASQSAARSSALARLTHATDGCTSSLSAYEQAESTTRLTLNPALTFHLWLTQYATVHGFLLASGANPREWSSTRRRMEEILRTSAGRALIDVDAFTTKAGRAREITNWVLGDGSFNYGTSLQQLADVIWQAETNIRSGLAPAYKPTLPTVGFSPRGRPEKPPRGRKLPGWRQMTLDECDG